VKVVVNSALTKALRFICTITELYTSERAEEEGRKSAFLLSLPTKTAEFEANKLGV